MSRIDVRSQREGNRRACEARFANTPDDGKRPRAFARQDPRRVKLLGSFPTSGVIAPGTYFVISDPQGDQDPLDVHVCP